MLRYCSGNKYNVYLLKKSLATKGISYINYSPRKSRGCTQRMGAGPTICSHLMVEFRVLAAWEKNRKEVGTLW